MFLFFYFLKTVFIIIIIIFLNSSSILITDQIQKNTYGVRITITKKKQITKI